MSQLRRTRGPGRSPLRYVSGYLWRCGWCGQVAGQRCATYAICVATLRLHQCDYGAYQHYLGGQSDS